MKRNMVPLVGIAFVVAIISTGVFYGLFAGKLRSSSGEMTGRPIVVAAKALDRGTVLEARDLRVSHVAGTLSGSFSKSEELVGATLLAAVKENEPLLEDRLTQRVGAASRWAKTVPAGMRAVSIRISESDGVVNLLNAGARVDIQAVSDKTGQAQLRTILENVEVLAVNPPADANGGKPRVVAVLTRAQDADLVALADSGARIRVTLRNALDEATFSQRPMALDSVFRAGAERVQSEGAADGRAAVEHPVELQVKVLAASAAALNELDSKLTGPGGAGSMEVVRFRPDAAPADLLGALEKKHELEVVASRKLEGALGRPISYQTSAAPYQLRVRFSPTSSGKAGVNLRVTPEITIRSGQGAETRQYDAEVNENADFLVRGLGRDPSGRRALERLFPAQSWSNRELVIFVESRVARPGSVASLGQTSEGH